MRTPARTGFRVLASTLVLAWVFAGCTGIRVREFTRESYLPPPELPAASRVLAAGREAVWSSLQEVLQDRNARLLETDPQSGRLVAALAWATPAEAASAVDLGRLRRVVTRTERRYRSYSVFDYDCNACVVRNGRVTGQETERVDEALVELDPARYRIEARLLARVSAARSGTRLELALALDPAPREPPEVQARSRGQLERVLLAAVAARLESPPPDLR